MLWQMHHQFKDGTTEFMSQREIVEYDPEFVGDWIAHCYDLWPLPKGVVWLLLNEKDSHFVADKVS